MFDVDGTLLRSNEFDADCCLDAVETMPGQRPDTDCTRYAKGSMDDD